MGYHSSDILINPEILGKSMERVPHFVTILLTLMLLLTVFTAFTATSGAKTIVVDDDWAGADFNNISAAVAASEDGDSIIVHNGTYREQVLVNRSVTIQGNGSQSTFLLGPENPTEGLQHNLFHIESSNVEIQGFHLSWENSSGSRGIFSYMGDIFVSDCVFDQIKYGISEQIPYDVDGRVVITRCRFYSCDLYLGDFSNGSVDDSEFIGCSKVRIYGLKWIVFPCAIAVDTAIDVEGSDHIIQGNTIHFKGVGIELMHTRRVTIKMNTISECSYGIDTICYNEHLRIVGNSFHSNSRAIFLSARSKPNTISDNEFLDNIFDIEYQVDPADSEDDYQGIIEYSAITIVVIILILSVWLGVRRKGTRMSRPPIRSPHRSRRP